MTFKDEIKNCMRLWIPPNLDTDPKIILPDYQTANLALEDFIQGNLSPDDFLEILQGANVNVDEYVAIVNINFRALIAS